MVTPLDGPRVGIAAARYVLLPLAAAMTGYTEKAIRKKIEDGVWIEGREFLKAPDGHLFVNVQGFERWVESTR